MIVDWSVPMVLIGIVWLLAMRHSAREVRRFGDAALSLREESHRLEARLKTINGELGLAREFISAQSRDLDALGRIAVERISGNAERLQGLIADNGQRLDTIGSISQAALGNMEELRSQLPVIASSARDVSNNIGMVGRTAQSQLDELVNGFSRLAEFGEASERQVASLRSSVGTAMNEFSEHCDHLERIADERFALLARRSEQLRGEIAAHEDAALSAVRARAEALSGEIEAHRQQLGQNEDAALEAMRAQLAILRDEGSRVAGSIREQERTALDSLRGQLGALREEHQAISAQIGAAHTAALDALSERLSRIDAEVSGFDARIRQSADRAVMEMDQRRAAFGAQVDAAAQQLGAHLAELDQGIAWRQSQQEQRAQGLADHADAIAGQYAEAQARLEDVLQRASDARGALERNLSALTGGIVSSRETLAAADKDVVSLTDASIRLLELVQAAARQTQDTLPGALMQAENRLANVEQGIERARVPLEQAAQHSDDLADGLGVSHEQVGDLVAQLSAAQNSLADRSEAFADRLVALRGSLAEIDAAAKDTAQHAAGSLGEALAELGRAVDESIARLETDSAVRVSGISATLASESGEAIERAMRERIAEVSGQLEQAVLHTSGKGREAASYLREQLSGIDELVANLEARIAEARATAGESIDGDFGRRVSLLTEALQSSAIDIDRALATDVPDTAWNAYLKGDRGIFTRRAVRLLSSGEAKQVQQIYQRDEEFRSQVNRYVADFEAVLREVFSTREGHRLAVTLLSSDMGKLYVALAQGIERLRR